MFHCLFASRAITQQKNGKDGDSEAVCSSSMLHKSHKNGPNSQNLPTKDLSIFFLFLLCLESQISPKPLSIPKRLILNFFRQNFLSLNSYGRITGRDIINGRRSKLTSQRQFPSVRKWTLFSFDHYKACQNIKRAPGFLHN